MAQNQKYYDAEGEEIVIEFTLDGTPIEPLCPCGVGVNRPKCFWEMGGDCPRHPYQEAYLLAKQQTEPERLQRGTDKE